MARSKNEQGSTRGDLPMQLTKREERYLMSFQNNIPQTLFVELLKTLK
jgi:hypothetical protein